MRQALPEALQTFTHPLDFRIFIDRNEGDWKMPFEWHEPLEIFYVLSGKGTYFIENKIYSFEKNDLFVIGNHELHKSQLVDGDSFEALVLLFHPSLVSMMGMDDGMNPLALFTERTADFSHQLRPDPLLRAKLEQCFELMMSEYARSEGYSLRSMAGLLQWLLVELQRAYAVQQPLQPANIFAGLRMKKIVSQVFAYINNHYREDLNLSQIATFLSVSPSYLSREFKQHTGYSLIEFIAMKRIRDAKELLQNSEMQVTAIGTHVGYNNITHFHWTFKKMVGVSPGQYRKMWKQAR